MWVDPELALRAIDRQFDFLLGADGARRLRLLPETIAFLEREPLTNAVLRDLQQEADRVLAVYEEACAESRAQLLAVWEEHGARLLDALADDASHTRDAYGGINNYENSLRIPPRQMTLPALMIGTQLVDEAPRRQARALHHWGKCVADRREEGETMPSWVEDVLERAQDVIHHVEHAFRTVQLAVESKGGFALASLRSIADQVHPNPTDIVTLAMHHDYRASIFSRTGGPSRSSQIEQDVSKVSEFAALLRDEVHQRLLRGLSRWAVVSRFAARCESFHRQRLREIAKRNTKAAERALTLEFAEYLFDSGFTPVLDPEIGGLKPDVIDAARSSLFYAEAKQYAQRSPRSQLVKAYHQVWSTWLRIEKQHTLREGFLIVFRRGGPLVVLPPVLVLGERRLYSILIDLALEAGSREKYKPVRIDPDSLMP